MKNKMSKLLVIITIGLGICCFIQYININNNKQISRNTFYNSINLMCIDIENLKNNKDISVWMMDLVCNLGKVEMSYLMTPYYNKNKDLSSTFYILDSKLTEEKHPNTSELISELSLLVPSLKKISENSISKSYIDRSAADELYKEIVKIQ